MELILLCDKWGKTVKRFYVNAEVLSMVKSRSAQTFYIIDPVMESLTPSSIPRHV